MEILQNLKNILRLLFRNVLEHKWVKVSTICLHVLSVTPGGVSIALPRSCLIFQSTVRTQENHDIFREKLSVTASSQHLRRCYGARMALHCVPTEFLVAILCAHTVLLLRVCGAHSVCAALSRHCHCADGVLKTQCKRHGRPRRLHSDPCARPRSSYCVVGDLTARL